MRPQNFENAIYEGVIEHRRYVDRAHFFKYSLYMLWLRVSEVDDVNKSWPMIRRFRWSPVSVNARDYMGHRQEATLSERLAGEIKDKLQVNWHGEAFMLAQPRHFGFVMNPLAVYYCYDSSNKLEYVVGEITNTPWGERHCYVFDMRRTPEERPASFSFKKEFHVSPFLPMDMDYTWKLNHPSRSLTVNIWNKVSDKVVFEAHLMLARRKLTVLEMIRQMTLKPLMTFKVWLGIYLNAGILYGIKRVRFYDHPKLTNEAAP